MRTTPSPKAVLVSIALGLAVVTSACGAGTKVSGGNVECDVDAPKQASTVQILAYSAPTVDPFTNAMVQGCSKVQNLTVKHGKIDFGAQLEKAQLSLSQGGKGSYDVVEVYSGTLPQYAAKGWLQPLDDLVKSSGSRYSVDGIDPKFLEAFTYEGKLYALPMIVSTHIMVYRKDILSGLGIKPPTTFAELTAAADKIKASGKVRYPLALTFGASSAIGAVFNSSLTSLGGQWVDPKTDKPQLTSPKAVAAVESLRKLKPYLDPGAMNFDQAQVQSALQNGQSAIGVLYSGSAAQLTKANQSKFTEQFGFTTPPAVEAGGGPWSTLNVDGFAVAKNAPNSAPLLFQVAAVGTGAGAGKAAGTGVFPARTAISKDPALIAKAPYWTAVQSTLSADVKTYPKKGYFAPMQTAVNPFLAAAVAGRTPVKKALQQAQTAAEKAVQAYTSGS